MEHHETLEQWVAKRYPAECSANLCESIRDQAQQCNTPNAFICSLKVDLGLAPGEAGQVCDIILHERRSAVRKLAERLTA